MFLLFIIHVGELGSKGLALQGLIDYLFPPRCIVFSDLDPASMRRGVRSLAPALLLRHHDLGHSLNPKHPPRPVYEVEVISCLTFLKGYCWGEMSGFLKDLKICMNISYPWYYITTPTITAKITGMTTAVLDILIV